MNDLIKKIEQWAEDRNIIKGSKPIDQAMKLFSEFGELADNIGKGRDCRDDIGDVFVVLTIISKQLGGSIVSQIVEPYIIDELSIKDEVFYLGKYLVELVDEFATYIEQDVCDCENAIESLQNICKRNGYTLQECVQIAYDDIKDRTGVMHNGVFVKSTDAKYEEILAELGKA